MLWHITSEKIKKFYYNSIITGLNWIGKSFESRGFSFSKSDEVKNQASSWAFNSYERYKSSDNW